jgi:NADPH-dependent curcumin reductase CurA
MTLEGGAIGEVIDSRAKEFKPGDAVTSNFGWREDFTASPNELHRVSREVCPLSAYLGALGMTGMTAWVGLKLAELKTGDVSFISGAAGAVGSVAGQLAKLRGCRAVLIATAEEPKHFGKLKREVQGILPFGRDELDYKGNDSTPSYSS